MTRDIGLDVEAPEQTCEDDNCPFHGTLPVRGQVLDGRVAKVDAEKTIIVERERLWKLPRFERFEKRTSRTNVHLPPCMEVTAGDQVTIAECRPLSKTKSFVVVETREAEARITGEEAEAPTFDDEEDEEDEEDEDEEEAEAPTAGGEA
jgi:small subunit ribosomal protein S17